MLRGTGALVELDASDARLGTGLKIAQLPSRTQAIPVAGGRYVILSYRPRSTGPTTLGVFDTRTFSASVVSQWTFPGGVTLQADRFRPRVFYRTANEVVVVVVP